jgi:hypothetical protein
MDSMMVKYLFYFILLKLIVYLIVKLKYKKNVKLNI